MRTKEVQGRLWSVAPDYWSKHFEPYFLPLYRNALQSLKLDKDDVVLDAGCGAGMFTSMAISCGAMVTGVDAAAGLLEVARERNPGTNFLEEDLEALPFAADAFDVVTGFNSFQYAGDFTNALREAKRVLKTGGRLVIGLWDVPEASDATQVLKAIGALLPPPPPGTPGPFALSEEGKVEGILDSIGFDLTVKAKVRCPILYRSLEEGVKSFMGTGPAAAASNHTSAKQVERAVRNALHPFGVANEVYHLENSFLLFVAKKR